MGGKCIFHPRQRIYKHTEQNLFQRKKQQLSLLNFQLRLFQRFLFSTFLIRNPIYSGPIMTLKCALGKRILCKTNPKEDSWL